MSNDAQSSPQVTPTVSETPATSQQQAALQAPTPPPANEPVVVDQKKDPNGFGRQFSALSRKEREIRERETKLAEREKAIKESNDWRNEIKRKLKLSPQEALKELDVDINYLVQTQLDGKVPESVLIQDLRSEIDQLKAQLSGKKPEEEAQAEPSEQDQQEQAVSEYKQGMFEFVSNDTEKYKLINDQEAHEVVYAVAEHLYAETVKQGNPRIPSYEECADAAEKYLRDELRKKAELLGIVSQPAVEPQGQGSKEVSSTGSSSSPTLSNQLSATRPTEASAAKGLSREERIARAASLLRNK